MNKGPMKGEYYGLILSMIWYNLQEQFTYLLVKNIPQEHWNISQKYSLNVGFVIPEMFMNKELIVIDLDIWIYEKHMKIYYNLSKYYFSSTIHFVLLSFLVPHIYSSMVCVSKITLWETEKYLQKLLMWGDLKRKVSRDRNEQCQQSPQGKGPVV